MEKRREASDGPGDDRPPLRLVAETDARPIRLRRQIDSYLREGSALRALLTRRPSDPEAGRDLLGDIWLRRGVVQIDDDADLIADPQPHPERAGGARRALEHLMTLTDVLPARQKEALLLYRVDGWSMAEVGRHMGISPRMVEVHVARAITHCDHHRTQARLLP